MNLYGYAAGDPINLSDPFGLNPACLTPAGAVLCIGVATISAAIASSATTTIGATIRPAVAASELNEAISRAADALISFAKPRTDIIMAGLATAALAVHSVITSSFPPPPGPCDSQSNRPAVEAQSAPPISTEMPSPGEDSTKVVTIDKEPCNPEVRRGRR